MSAVGVARVRLRARRIERGFSQASLAEAVGVAPATVSDWEQGRRLPHADTRPALAENLDVTRPELALLLGEPATPNGHEVPEWLGHLASLEQAAARIWVYEPVVVHGLLQTADYATAVERSGPHRSEDYVAQKVGTRMARQAVLTRSPDPLQLAVLLDESVLLRVAGGPVVMAAQLDHLAAAAQMPNVKVQVLPLNIGVFSAAFGSFSCLASADSSPKPAMAITEDRGTAHYLERRPVIEEHMDLWHYLSDSALTRDESLDLIRSTAEEKYSDDIPNLAQSIVLR